MRVYGRFFLRVIPLLALLCSTGLKAAEGRRPAVERSPPRAEVVEVTQVTEVTKVRTNAITAAPPLRVRRTPLAFPVALSLDAAIFMALEHNPEIRRARYEIERLKGQVITVRAQALPSVTLTASYQREDEALSGGGAGLADQLQSLSQGGAFPTPTPTPRPTPTPTPGPTPGPSPSPGADTSAPAPAASPSLATESMQSTSWQVTVQVTQTLYAGGRIAASIRAAKLTRDQSVFQLRDVIDRVIANVRQQFAQALVNRHLVVVQEESVALLREQVDEQISRFRAGTVPQFNVLQAEVALANALPALILARNNERIAQLQLARTLGQSTAACPQDVMPFLLIGSLELPEITVSLGEALEMARARRPSLKAQRQNILIEAEELDIARAGYKPVVQATAGYTVQNNRFSGSLSDTLHGWFLGVQGSWEIFDGFETYGNVLQARARIQSAWANYEESMLTTELEVQQSWANLQQALETVASQMMTEEQAIEAVRQATERLATGVGTQLDLLNSTVALTQARVTTLQARYQFIASAAEFERAIGAATVYNELFPDPLANPKRRLWKHPPQPRRPP